MTPGQWRYDPDRGSIVWHGTWEDGFRDGEWWLEQKAPDGEWTQWRYRISINYDLGAGYVRMRSHPTGNHGDWDGAFPGPSIDESPSIDLPWILPGTATFRAWKYAEIRADGIDPNDLAPVTWNYSTPW